MLLAGTRSHRLIAYSEDFLMLTRPATRVGTVKIHPSHGITVNGLQYWHDSMRSTQVAGQTVAVRYEPYDMGQAAWANQRFSGVWKLVVAQKKRTPPFAEGGESISLRQTERKLS
jgi:hypothetical protein